jgi:hypothetical protein
VGQVEVQTLGVMAAAGGAGALVQARIEPSCQRASWRVRTTAAPERGTSSSWSQNEPGVADLVDRSSQRQQQLSAERTEPQQAGRVGHVAVVSGGCRQPG